MATVSNTIKLGTSNPVQIGSVPDRQYAEVSITINDTEILTKSLSAGKEDFGWNLGFGTDDFSRIFNTYFNSNISSVSAKMTVTVFFSTGVKNLLRGGKYDVSLQLIEDNNTKPIINSVALSPVSDKKFSKYIQGKTKAKCIVDSEGQLGAGIKTVSVSIDGKNCKSTDDGLVSDWLCNAGDRNVVITVTDTRGFKSTKTEEIHVEPYSPPVIVPAGSNASIICGRWNPNIDKFDDSNGTQCRLLFGVYASYIEGINTSFDCSYKYRITGSEDIVDGAIITQIPFTSSSSQSVVDLTIEDDTIKDENGKMTGCFGVENEYLVELTVTDSLGEKTMKVFRLDVLECIWHIIGKRFSVGKYATKDELFDSAWDIHTDKNIDANGNISAKGTVSSLGTPLSVENGGTGATTKDQARKNLDVSLTNLGVSASADDLNLMKGVKSSGVTSDNIKYLKGLTSNVQSQLNGKSDSTHSHEGYSPVSHSHSDYASKTHKHNIDDITTAPVTNYTLKNIIPQKGDGITLIENESFVTVWGKVCEIYITFSYNQNLTEGNISNIKVGILGTSYRPTRFVACHTGGTGPVISGEITKEGELRIAATGSSVTAGTYMSLSATYLLP